MLDRVKENLVEIIKVYADFLSQDTIDAIADSIIAEGVTVQEWISVKDRLPEYGSIVFTFCDDGSIGIRAYFGFFEKIVRVVLSKLTFAEVTHWMPLPQPPKGE